MKSTIINPKSRLKYIDALRGFTMILVVFSHIINNMALGDTSLQRFFILFRMPTFFFISGYLAFKTTETWNLFFYKKEIIKRFKIQILPTIFFFILYCIYSGYFEIGRFWRGYWFTLTLFLMFFIYHTILTICKLTNNSKFLDLSLVTISMLMLFFNFYLNFNSIIEHIFCFEHLSKYFHFFVLGILCRKYNNQFISKLNNDYIKTTIILSFIIGLVIFYEINVPNDHLQFIFNNIILRYIGLLVILIYFFSKEDYFNIPNNKISYFLQYIGRHTLDIYLLHYFLLPNLQFFSEELGLTKNWFMLLILALSISLIIIVFCLLISNILRTSNILSRYLFGVKISG